LRLRILAVLLLLPALNNLAGAQRLPTSVIPSHYKLWIDPNIEKQQSSGEETIDVLLAQASNEIVLNSLNLEISSAEVIAGGKTEQAKVSYDQPEEMIRLIVAEAIPPGPAALHLKFRQPHFRTARFVPEQDRAPVLCGYAV